MDSASASILVTGASGYVGSRLAVHLKNDGRRVRLMARRPENLPERVRQAGEAVRGDVLDRESLPRVLDGIDVAYYLVHSMDSAGSFADEDRTGARNFAAAAAEAGVRKIIYLGGLGADDKELSPHLRSRHETGQLLAAGSVPVVEFRASVVIGDGSLSFELLRALVDRLPVMITPSWVSTPAQPISIRDLLDYLAVAIDTESTRSVVYEIGGRDVTTYGELMEVYGRLRGLRRWMIPVPVLTPNLSSLWLALVTPVHARVGRKLIESIRHPTTVRDDRARRDFAVEPMTVEEAVRTALEEANAR